VEGTAFATALYQSGGLPLLSVALAHPPASTEQVLHPEKYLAAELPVVVSIPPVVDGEIVDAGTLNELQTRVYLSQCTQEGIARSAAKGWGGDAYVVVRDARWRPRDPVGHRLGHAGGAAGPSRPPFARGSAAPNRGIACRSCVAGPRSPSSTLHRATRIAPTISSNSRSPRRRRRRRPGACVLRTIPPPEPQFLRQGHMTTRVTYVSEPLGLTVTLPGPSTDTSPDRDAELEFRATGLTGAMWFFFQPLIPPCAGPVRAAVRHRSRRWCLEGLPELSSPRQTNARRNHRGLRPRRPTANLPHDVGNRVLEPYEYGDPPALVPGARGRQVRWQPRAARSGPSAVAGEKVVQLLTMAPENPSWGYTRLRGALANLGLHLGRSTIQRILKEHGIEPAPTRGRMLSWRTFLKAHWDAIGAADFFGVEVLTRAGLVRYLVFFVIELRIRPVRIAGIGCNPQGDWMVQLARNLTDATSGFLKGARHLIVDRDPLYTEVRSPGVSARHIIPLGERHLRSRGR
jgi:hypothetical protein